jgi:hypothetical protein
MATDKYGAAGLPEQALVVPLGLSGEPSTGDGVKLAANRADLS